MIDKINFNKKIKYSDIETGSLIWVNFGETKHLFLKEMERQLKEECFNIQDCPHGLNLLHEFSYYHMAFLVSNKFNDTVAVVPLTEYKHDDEKYINLNQLSIYPYKLKRKMNDLPDEESCKTYEKFFRGE